MYGMNTLESFMFPYKFKNIVKIIKHKLKGKLLIFYMIVIYTWWSISWCDDVLKVIFKLKLGKEPGNDGIYVEHTEYGNYFD